MPLLYKDRVKEVASNKPNASTAFNLPDSAPAGFQSFDAAYATGETMECMATNGTAWESFVGTFTAGTPDTLARTTLLASSTGSAIDWSSGGDVTIFVTPSASSINNLDPNTTIVTGDGTNKQSISGSTWTKVTNLNTVVRNPSGWWSTANKRFLPLRAGVYSIGVASVLGNVGAFLDDGKKIIVSIYKNGAHYRLLSRGYTGGAVATAGFGSMLLVEANGTTDYFELYVFHDNGTAVDNYADAFYNYFTATWVGK